MDILNANTVSDATIIRGSGMSEYTEAHGEYKAICYDQNGDVKWESNFPNIVTTVGKNYALDCMFSATNLTTVGPYMGIISGSGYASTPVLADTMTSHPTWFEAYNATFTPIIAARATLAWSSAASGSKTLSSNANFSITGSGTAKGCFIVTSTSASAATNNTSGVLYSAGLFSGGDKAVGSGDTLSVSYTASL